MNQKILDGGILLMIYHEDKRIEERLIPKEAIYITRKKFGNREIIMPVINLTSTYEVIKLS